MSQIKQNLRGATVVITGASSGFGRGTALSLGELGANVVLAARRTALLEELADTINNKGGTAIAVTVDVSDPDEVIMLAHTAADCFGKIDVWINNVGVGALGFFWDIPIEDHARLIDVNLKGVVYGAHAAMKQFIQQGYGHLINIGSIDSEVPLAYQNTYAATKAAVLSLSKSLNEELRLVGMENKIRVGTIMPWAVDTPWWTHAANYTGHAPRMFAMDDPKIVIEAIVNACLDPKEKQPVGPIAKMSAGSHQLFPDLTERMSANIADKEVAKGTPVPNTTGSLYESSSEGASIDGGIRKRMEQEDA